MGFPYPRFIRPYQVAKLWSRTVPGDDGCMIWTGAATGGYPQMRLHGRSMGAHRVAWVAANNAEIPDGYQIDHTCRNSMCINPEHLEAVTKQENMRRMWVARGAPDIKPVGDKTCHRCRKTGTRGYVWDGQRWSCKHEKPCQRRANLIQNPPTPNWQRCAECAHMRRRHYVDKPGCAVINCACQQERW